VLVGESVAVTAQLLGQGSLAAVGPFDHRLAVRWPDGTPDRGTLRQMLARNAID
jgi:hypothetical protein